MNDFELVRFPPSRVMALDGPAVVADKHFMSGLLELDVTELRRTIRAANRRGEQTSLTAWLIKAVGDCVARNPLAHAIARGPRELVLFNEVDVTLPIEKEVDGKLEPLPILIRSANRKSVAAIHGEIAAFRDRAITDERDYVRDEHRLSSLWQAVYYRLPRRLRLAILRRFITEPLRAKRYTGTVYLTTVNAPGALAGWVLPSRSACNLSIALGSVTPKPWVVDGRIEVREILHLAVSFNHDVIDGVPARKFIRDLVRTIEHGSPAPTASSAPA